MSLTIVTTSPSFGKVGRVPDALKERGWTLIRCNDMNLPDGGIAAHLAEMDILVVGLVPATEAMIQASPQLRAILKHGVGVDNIDIPAATARGIPVINAPGSNSNAVAELALTHMLVLARNLTNGHRSIVEGGWLRKVGTELAGKTLGIVGLGNIGKALARKAIALGMDVIAHDVYQDSSFARENGVTFCEMDELLPRSDYISLHVFGGKANTHLIGARELSAMKPGAFLINIARGEIVDLDALDSALRDGGHLAGAGIDAYTVEPPDRSHPIFSNPRVVFTPHSGGDTTESIERMGMMNIADIDVVVAGGRSPHTLNPDVFASSESR